MRGEVSGRPLVLLVEDNEVNHLVAGEMLEMLGCEFQLADNGQVALAMLAESAPTWS